jgi:hypothetical protein
VRSPSGAASIRLWHRSEASAAVKSVEVNCDCSVVASALHLLNTGNAVIIARAFSNTPSSLFERHLQFIKMPVRHTV